MSLLAPAKVIEKVFDVLDVPIPPRRYNLAPTDDVLTVTAAGGERAAALMRWGLVPWWAKDLKIGARMINARAETAPSKSAFKQAFRERRCLIVTDGFYEWQREGKAKLPWRIGMEDGQPYALAGIWDAWKGPDGDRIRTCSVLTTDANALVGRIHDRMPVILPPGDWDAWMDPENQDLDDLVGMLRPFDAAAMVMDRVSTHVNSVKNDDERCVVPLEGPGARVHGQEVIE